MKKIRLLFQGDSITDACRNREEFYDLGEGYPKYAAKYLTEKYPQEDEVHSYGCLMFALLILTLPSPSRSVPRTASPGYSALWFLVEFSQSLGQGAGERGRGRIVRLSVLFPCRVTSEVPAPVR